MAKKTVRDYFDAAGINQTELARTLKVSQPAVASWLMRDQIPAERVLAVEAATGIDRGLLRPDLYPDD